MSFDRNVNIDSSGIVYVYAAVTKGETYQDTEGNSATLYHGRVIDSQGQNLVSYCGTRKGVSTWNDLSTIRDVQNWYAYENDKLALSVTDLYFTENLVFSTDSQNVTVVLPEAVDLGIGYAEFRKSGRGETTYTIKSSSGVNAVFDHAGYVINEGVSVKLMLTNPADHMAEWRKIGDGNLVICGNGDTNALINVGGTGYTYLRQNDGYAAYNVLINTGATVVIDDINQIARDCSFGAGGGILDMNGSSMDWFHACDDVAAEGFTINALTEEAVITNKGEKQVVLTYRERGNQKYAGSFTDSEKGALHVDYQAGGTWVLNSIHTRLTHADSGLTVSNGRVVLAGTNTVHGMGSAGEGYTADRLVRENDWHYADAAMDVVVKPGAGFELGSHARLSGKVTVQKGGTYTMREGVQQQYEYIEGGIRLEDTYEWDSYYGHHGDIQLDGVLNIAFSEGVTANTSYTGNIYGSGDIVVDAADGSVTLAGRVTSSGKREVVGGTLVIAGAESLSAGVWDVKKNAAIAFAINQSEVDLPEVKVARTTWSPSSKVSRNSGANVTVKPPLSSGATAILAPSETQ